MRFKIVKLVSLFIVLILMVSCTDVGKKEFDTTKKESDQLNVHILQSGILAKNPTVKVGKEFNVFKYDDWNKTYLVSNNKDTSPATFRNTIGFLTDAFDIKKTTQDFKVNGNEYIVLFTLFKPKFDSKYFTDLSFNVNADSKYVKELYGDLAGEYAKERFIGSYSVLDSLTSGCYTSVTIVKGEKQVPGINSLKGIEGIDFVVSIGKQSKDDNTIAAIDIESTPNYEITESNVSVGSVIEVAGNKYVVAYNKYKNEFSLAGPKYVDIGNLKNNLAFSYNGLDSVKFNTISNSEFGKWFELGEGKEVNYGMMTFDLNKLPNNPDTIEVLDMSGEVVYSIRLF